MPSIDLAQVLRAMPDERLVGLALAECAPEERLERAAALLGTLQGTSVEAHGAREALARGLRGLVREAPETLGAWLDAQWARSPGADWLCARLFGWLGDARRAEEAWDAVIEREFGPRVDRHLSRARLRLDGGDVASAAHDLREAFRDPTGHRDLERGARLLAKLRRKGEPLPAKRRVKLALLGGSTTQLMRPLLELVCFRDGIDAEVYEPEYGLYRQEVLDRSSGLHRFAPDVVLIATHWRDAQLPPLSEDPDSVVDGLVSGFEALWEICRRELRAHVIQHGFDLPPNESYGGLGKSLAGGRARVLARANLELLARAGPGVSILDIAAVASSCGDAGWGAPGLWYLAKQHPAPEALGPWADAVAAQLRALFGLGKKVLALDLDNTLWGGV
ncbi:MAG: hypothetical protein ABFS41_19300, partial [Myxococcota bacterium]